MYNGRKKPLTALQVFLPSPSCPFRLPTSTTHARGNNAPHTSVSEDAPQSMTSVHQEQFRVMECLVSGWTGDPANSFPSVYNSRLVEIVTRCVRSGLCRREKVVRRVARVLPFFFC